MQAAQHQPDSPELASTSFALPLVGHLYQLNLPPENTLYVNDNYQYGIWIQESLNTQTTLGGNISSGRLSTDHPVRIIAIHKDCIEVAAQQVDGANAGNALALITPELFQRCFVKN